MRINYNITAADQRAKLERYTRGSPHSKWFPPLSYVVICGLSWVTAARFYFEQPEYPVRWVMAASVAGVLTIFLPWLYRWYQASFFAYVLNENALDGIIGPKALLVSDQRVEEIGGILTASSEWRNVRRIERDHNHTFIFLAPMIAIAVPASAFGDVSERENFEALIESYRSQATS